jgi:NADPH:quinone reductase-like Zn-dependent oxidoreductase
MGSIEQILQYRRAIVVDPADSTHSIRDNVPLPAPQPHEFIIRTDAIATSPSDLKMRGPSIVPDGILGIDCAGTVTCVGSNVTDLKPVDRVCGPQHSMHVHSPHYGAFTDYAVCSGDVWMRVPESTSIEGAASLGAGTSTAGLGIKLLGLPLPDAPISQEKKVYVLVCGGATATGNLAIQLLEL